MRKFTHSVVSLSFTAILLSFLSPPSLSPFIKLIFYGIGFAIGGLNDWLDFTLFTFLPHRNKITHGFFSPLGIILGVLGYWIGQVITGISPLLLAGVFFGAYYLHLIMDMGNPSGVYVWGDRKIHGSRPSNDLGSNALFVAISVGVLVVILVR